LINAVNTFEQNGTDTEYDTHDQDKIKRLAGRRICLENDFV
jgi:hypothetical protein